VNCDQHNARRAAALADGKTGPILGAELRLYSTGAWGAFMRFGWGWNQNLGPIGKDIIRLRIGAARGNAWYSDWTFWIMR
jgi:hypothetical protein